jgi:hypothetical protein
MKRTAILGATVAALALPALAGLNSGLKPGQQITPFHPKHLAGPLAGTDKCFPCTFGNRPQVQVWVNNDDPKNVTALARDLSKAMTTYQGKEFKALVVFITTPATAAKTEATVREIAKSPDVKNVAMAVVDSKHEAVTNYSINTAANVKNTVFAYKDWTVANTFVNLTGDAKGLGALNTAIAKVAK